MLIEKCGRCRPPTDRNSVRGLERCTFGRVHRPGVERSGERRSHVFSSASGLQRWWCRSNTTRTPVRSCRSMTSERSKHRSSCSTTSRLEPLRTGPRTNAPTDRARRGHRRTRRRRESRRRPRAPSRAHRAAARPARRPAALSSRSGSGELSTEYWPGMRWRAGDRGGAPSPPVAPARPRTRRSAGGNPAANPDACRTAPCCSTSIDPDVDVVEVVEDRVELQRA